MAVDSISETGQPQLSGDVTLSEGTGITLTQVGQDIEISATAASPVAGYNAWYDASDVGTLTIVSNRVSQWNDKSASGFNLAQATAGDRPFYDSTPRFINSVTCPEFTATVEFMESACPMDDRTMSAFIVMQIDTGAGSKTPLGDTQGGGFEVRIAGTVVQHLKSGVAVLATSSLAIPVSIPQIYCSQMDATTHYMHWPGIPPNTTVEGTTFTAGRTLRIGADTTAIQAMDGLIAEILIYPTTLSAADVSANFQYLAGKWY